MSQNKNNIKRDIGAVIDFALDTSSLTNEEIIDELRESGVDVDIAIPKILANINKKVFQKKWTDIAFENKAKMSSIAKEIADNLSVENGNLLDKIRELLSSGQIQLQHRDYKDLTEGDLFGLLEDVEFLRKLDESKRKG